MHEQAAQIVYDTNGYTKKTSSQCSSPTATNLVSFMRLPRLWRALHQQGGAHARGLRHLLPAQPAAPGAARGSGAEGAVCAAAGAALCRRPAGRQGRAACALRAHAARVPGAGRRAAEGALKDKETLNPSAARALRPCRASPRRWRPRCRRCAPGNTCTPYSPVSTHDAHAQEQDEITLNRDPGVAVTSINFFLQPYCVASMRAIRAPKLSKPAQLKCSGHARHSLTKLPYVLVLLLSPTCSDDLVGAGAPYHANQTML